MRSERWHQAFATVPRHRFLPAFFRIAGNGWEPVSPSVSGAEAWLEAVYSDQPCITQLDEHLTPDEVDGVVEGEPTSSSSMPSLMAVMLECLDFSDDAQILEVGTGSGYNAAILTTGLGSDQVTTVEVDPGVAADARQVLTDLGLTPRVIVGDGLASVAEPASFDRITATCSVSRVPRAWIRQVRPGGRILATLTGPLYGSAQVLLSVDDRGAAEGRFVNPESSFMRARTPKSSPEEMGWAPRRDILTTAPRCPAKWPLAALDQWPINVLAQWAAPGATRGEIGYGEHGQDWVPMLHDGREATSFAAFSTDATGQVMVAEGGPRRLWTAVEDILTVWTDSGRAGLDAFRMRIDPDGVHTIHLDRAGRAWTLQVDQPTEQDDRPGSHVKLATPNSDDGPRPRE
ncbi:MAG: methyltransferase domain-containing protein [Haloechinothrix sp.]